MEKLKITMIGSLITFTKNCPKTAMLGKIKQNHRFQSMVISCKFFVLLFMFYILGSIIWQWMSLAWIKEFFPSVTKEIRLYCLRILLTRYTEYLLGMYWKAGKYDQINLLNRSEPNTKKIELLQWKYWRLLFTKKMLAILWLYDYEI